MCILRNISNRVTQDQLQIIKDKWNKVHAITKQITANTHTYWVNSRFSSPQNPLTEKGFPPTSVSISYFPAEASTSRYKSFARQKIKNLANCEISRLARPIWHEEDPANQSLRRPMNSGVYYSSGTGAQSQWRELSIAGWSQFLGTLSSPPIRRVAAWRSCKKDRKIWVFWSLVWGFDLINGLFTLRFEEC